MKKIIITAILLHLLLNFCSALELTVNATSFRNDNGLARVAVFSGAKGFPDKPTNLKHSGSVKIINSRAKIKFSNIPAGEYAITVLHDEDSNGKVKLGLLGIPQEGYGLSNQTKGIFGQPKYKTAKIKLQKQQETVTINIFY